MIHSITGNHKIANQILAMAFMALSCLTYSQTRNITQLKKEIKELRNSNGFVPVDKRYIDLLLELAHGLNYSQTDSVRIISEETLELSKKLDYEKGRLESIINFGFYELFNGNTDKAVYYYKKNLNESLSIRFPKLAIQAYNGIGQANFIRSDYPKSYISFLKALEIAQKTDNSEMIILMNSNIGTLFALLQDYDEALIYYNKSQTKFTSSTMALTKIQVFVNLGYLYAKKQENKKALEYLTRSISMLKNEEAKRILAFAYLTTGDVYIQMLEYEKALGFFAKANSIYKTINDKKGEADLYFATGMAHFNLNELTKAENYYTKSLERYNSFSLKTGMEKCYQALYDLNKKKGFDTESLRNLELAQKYGDSVEKNKKKRDISMLRAKISFEKSKAEITKKNQIKIKNKRKYVQWTTVGLIVTIVLTLLFFHVNRRKRKLNRELTLQTLVLSNKQEELNTINKNQDKLFSIVGHDLRGPIKSLKLLLGTALEKDTQIQNFYTYGPKLKKDVDYIHFTLDNLLNWGLIQMKGDVTKPEVTLVKEQFLEIVGFFDDAVSKKKITIKQHIPDTAELTLDTNHFNIIFRNLLSNAIKFTPKDGIIAIVCDIKNKSTTIGIKDNGIGISKEVKEKILNNTTHYSSLGTNNERGTGLGLILCTALVKKNKGQIDIESTLGQGSTFSVHFDTDDSKT